MIEESQVVLHEGDEPDFIAHIFHAHLLPGEDLAQIDLSFYTPLDKTSLYEIPEHCEIVAAFLLIRAFDNQTTMTEQEQLKSASQRSKRSARCSATPSWT